MWMKRFKGEAELGVQRCLQALAGVREERGEMDESS